MMSNSMTIINDMRIASFLKRFYKVEERIYRVSAAGELITYRFDIPDALESALSYCEKNPSDPDARYFFMNLLADTIGGSGKGA